MWHHEARTFRGGVRHASNWAHLTGLSGCAKRSRASCAHTASPLRDSVVASMFFFSATVTLFPARGCYKYPRGFRVSAHTCKDALAAVALKKYDVSWHDCKWGATCAGRDQSVLPHVLVIHSGVSVIVIFVCGITNDEYPSHQSHDLVTCAVSDGTFADRWPLIPNQHTVRPHVWFCYLD